MQGVEERDYNGIHITRLHYTADPAKCSEDWKTQAHEGYGSERQWRREMEIDWTVSSGLGIYSDDFNREFHVAKEELLAYPDKPIIRAWDFGLTPACVWCQIDAMGRINVLAEHVTWDGRGEMKQKGIFRFGDECKLLSSEWWPGTNIKWQDWADPAGWQKAQTDEKTCIHILNDHGIYPIPGPVTWESRKRAMVGVLGQFIGGRARLLISPNCHMLIEGFEGAYRYDEIGETGKYKETVEKNAWSHPMNALEYAIGGLFVQTLPNDRKQRKHKAGDDVTGY